MGSSISSSQGMVYYQKVELRETKNTLVGVLFLRSTSALQYFFPHGKK